jgi:hypothetical protein
MSTGALCTFTRFTVLTAYLVVLLLLLLLLFLFYSECLFVFVPGQRFVLTCSLYQSARI